MIRRALLLAALLALVWLLWRVVRWGLPWDPEIVPEPDVDEQGEAPIQSFRYLTGLQWFTRQDLEDFRPDELQLLDEKWGPRYMYLAVTSARGIEEWADPQPAWTSK